MLTDFLQSLFERGRVRFAATELADSDLEACDVEQLLADWDSATLQDFPGEAPALVRPVAQWAAKQFYRACRFVVCRDADAKAIQTSLAIDCPNCEPASQHYSVDLVFRFLPDLYRITRTVAEDDPLCEQLRQWAASWPLSSVGMPAIAPGKVDAIVQHPGMLRVYVDRIIARSDQSRLGDPRVCAAVRTALGQYTELASNLTDALVPAPEMNFDE